ncbi:DNA polymerase III subunit delta [Helicobacter sp. 16-1353]|uniref:DNA polymerase III subunit delta n=1 Tax=Helicobacter sp. 16-1353 TaxID=2004996 RepID=UPI0015EEC9DB|nr:DNA polymerase III subunit delta [Helicobacter sp. 16-1353]
MYKKEFDNLLKSRIPQATLLYGECNFLIDYYGKKIKNAIIEKESVDIFSFYFDEYNSKAINDIFSQPSLFSNTSLVIIKMDSLKLGIRKTKTDDIKQFLKILKTNTANYLIIEFYNDNSMAYKRDTKTLSALFNSQDSINVRFFNPNQKEAIEILQNCANELGININQTNLLYLYGIQNNEIGICVNELQKFTIFDKEITKATIDELCYGLFTNSIDELCDTMLLRGDYVKIFTKIEEKGITDIDIITAMHNYFYRLFLFFSYIKSNGRCSSKDVLGYALPRDIEEKYIRFATRLRESQYLQIFRTLNNWRFLSVSGKDKNCFPNLIKIQAIIK